MQPRPLQTWVHPSTLGAAAPEVRGLWKYWLTTSCWLALSACASGPHNPAWAGDCGDRPHDEIWLVSERHVACVNSGEDPGLRAQRFVPGVGWQSADIHELYQPTTPDQIMVVFVHGNRVPSEAVAPEGRQMYRLLTARVGEAPPMRFVIWSWPSAQIRGQLHDVRVKAERTELSGYCLAWLLTHVPESQHVSLLGFSFGARIASGAMHLVGGGQLSGRVLPPHSKTSPNTRIVMIAGALHDNWLRPGGYHSLAVSHLDHLLNLFNCCDPVLKRYHALYKHSHATALGYSGMYTGDLGELAEHIEQHDGCDTVGNAHDAIDYLASPFLLQRIRTVLFWRLAHGDAKKPLSGQHVATAP